MEGLFIYFFMLIILIVALAKWNLGNLEKIKELQEENLDLIKSNSELLETSIILTKKLKIRNKL